MVLPALIGLAGLGIQAYQAYKSSKKDKPQKIPTMTAGQQKLNAANVQRLLQMGVPIDQAINMLSQYADPQSDVYQGFEAPYMRQFEEETLPGIAERFAGAGAQGGALSSSGFGQALGGAGAQLQANLAGLKSQMSRQAINDLMNFYTGMSGQTMQQQPFAYYQQDKGAGAMPGFSQGAGQTGWDYLSRYNKDFGKGYQPQYPLTNMYSTMFQTGELY